MRCLEQERHNDYCLASDLAFWLGMEENNPVGTLLGVVLGTTEWLMLGFWLGMEEDDPVE